MKTAFNEEIILNFELPSSDGAAVRLEFEANVANEAGSHDAEAWWKATSPSLTIFSLMGFLPKLL